MELSEAGYFSKTHGIKGALILKTYCELDVETLKAIFVEANGGKAPYFIEEVKEIQGGLILRLEGWDAVEKVKLLINKKVFVASECVLAEEESDSDWLGYELIDHKAGSLGKVENVLDNGVQLLLSLTYKGHEVILPLVDDFIEKTDEEARKIWYNAPEGLIDLYLEQGQ
ncbi:MAG: hypothetical protein IT236_09235 [Bacteroidia bacterium]|nr:hypothetical protein [Bacteroidia bacterium]